jgi:SAM-dependent methyltransferase
MRSARRALVLGDGDGRFTSALLGRNKAVQVDAVDVSEGMLRSLRHRAGADARRVRTESQDVRGWHPAQGAEYDLVVTHFFLDCLATEDIQQLAERLKPSLRTKARWVVSEFAVPRSAFGRWVARPVIGLLYGAFRLLTGLEVGRLPEWQMALEEAGFRRIRERLFLHGLLTSEMWTMRE